MSTERVEMEVVSAAGNIHPGNCWGQWDGNAPECAKCQITKNCEEETKRLARKEAAKSAAKPAPAPSKPVEPPAPKPAPKPTPKTPETPEEIIIQAVKSRKGWEHTTSDKGALLFIEFLNSKGEKFLGALVMKTTGKVKLHAASGEKILDTGFTEKEVNKALDEIL